jgi:hypothetical protein
MEMDAQQTQVKAIMTAGKAMAVSNKTTDVKAMMSIVKEFEKQSANASLTTESLDDLFEDNEEEADEEITKIFEELSIEQTGLYLMKFEFSCF